MVVKLLGGAFGGQEEFVVADGEMVEQIFLFGVWIARKRRIPNYP
jgi:hypothetical protein